VILSALDLDVLRLCAIEDWASPEGQTAWAALAVKHGAAVNEKAVRMKLYRAGMLDVGDRVTFAGRVELWAADLGTQEMLERAS
jgi:hypothetical protein